MIGFAMCGSYCTHAMALRELEALSKDGYEVLPIISENVSSTDTRFGKADTLKKRLFEICKREPVANIVSSEPLGPKMPLEVLVICPCTGNTLAKLASGITDTSVTMAAKAHLATNDAMSANLGNIGKMLNRKNVYFVPMLQDDPVSKPHSLVADFSLLRQTLDAAMVGKQYRKLFL